jgi:hypothetical protein
MEYLNHPWEIHYRTRTFCRGHGLRMRNVQGMCLKNWTNTTKKVAYVYIYICIYLYMYASLFIYIYMHTEFRFIIFNPFLLVNVDIYIYTYIHTYFVAGKTGKTIIFNAKPEVHVQKCS